MSLLKTYFSPSGTTHAAKIRDGIRVGAAGVTALYAVGLFYRCGGVKLILPGFAYTKLVGVVEKVKDATQPLVNKERYGLAVKHLTKTYALVAAGFTTAAAGTLVFFRAPDVPIGIPIVVSASTGAVLLFGSQYMIEPAKILTFLTMAFSVGVTFGPMNWIAYDSLAPMIIIVGSTTVGFSIPLLITRGAISYFLSSQLLSSSLAIVLTSLNTINEKGTLSVARGRANEDINVMLTVQMMCNLLLGALHTIPTIHTFLSTKDISALQGQDYVRQAAMIFGAASFACWKAFQMSCQFILKRVSKDKGALSKEERSVVLGSSMKSVRIMSNVGASILSFALYVRFVSYVQSVALHPNADPDAVVKMFENIRKIFARLSPLNLV